MFLFATSEILVAGEVGLEKQDQLEVWASWYDIFVRHAFGSYRDVLREVSYAPAMGEYRTLEGNTAVFDNAREGAKHLREDESNPYLQVMFDLDELAKKNLENPISPDQVAEVILHAATARRPKERYYTPFSAGLQAWFMHLLPARMKDAVLKRVYGTKAYQDDPQRALAPKSLHS